MAATTQTARAGLAWKDVCEDPHLRDLPYKIETSERGQIIMTATYLKHGKFQFRIGQLLAGILTEGEVVTEAAVCTSKGTKVPGLVWCSRERWNKIEDDYEATIAPEICVEVLSFTEDEMSKKRRLYFEAGPEEVWLCSAEGRCGSSMRAARGKSRGGRRTFPHR